MPNHEIEGELLDSFHIAFKHEKFAIEPRIIAQRVSEQVEGMIKDCCPLKQKSTYGIFVLFKELQGDGNAISKGKESEYQERVLYQRQA